MGHIVPRLGLRRFLLPVANHSTLVARIDATRLWRCRPTIPDAVRHAALVGVSPRGHCRPVQHRLPSAATVAAFATNYCLRDISNAEPRRSRGSQGVQPNVRSNDELSLDRVSADFDHRYGL